MKLSGGGGGGGRSDQQTVHGRDSYVIGFI